MVVVGDFQREASYSSAPDLDNERGLSDLRYELMKH